VSHLSLCVKILALALAKEDCRKPNIELRKQGHCTNSKLTPPPIKSTWLAPLKNRSTPASIQLEGGGPMGPQSQRQCADSTRLSKTKQFVSVPFVL
jgi:hypothetical protein